MQNDITQTSQTDLAGTVTDYSVDTAATEGISEQKETEYTNTNFSKWYGYYLTTAIKKPIDCFATWVLGKGFSCPSPRDKGILDNITGWGEDTFLSIMWNALIVKKFNGDSYTQIIRNDEGILINLKPLDPSVMKTIVGRDGLIIRYEQTSKIKQKSNKKYKPQEILHLVNDRVADSIHGTAICEAAEWVILARKEAMNDWKRISHRSTIRVLYVDEDDKTRLANLKKDYAEGIENGEVLIIPGKPEDIRFEDLKLPPVEAFLAWIRYLDNEFYRAVGIPKSLTGDVDNITESGGKMAYLNHEPNYNREVTDLEADIWNQLAIRVTFNKQASLKDSVNDTENKNNAQTGFQPNDTQAGVGK